MTRHSDPRILPGFTVLPPMIEDRPDREPDTEPKPKGKPPGTADAAGRFTVLNDFVDVTMCDLSRAELAVWLCLWRDTRNGTARTAQTDLARRCGCHRVTVTDALARLVKRGLVRVVRQGGLNRGMSVYRVQGVA